MWAAKMTRNLVVVRPWDIEHADVAQTTQEVSFDGGRSFRAIKGNEVKDGIDVQQDQPFATRVSRQHYWTVVQPLVVKPPQRGGNEPSLEFDGPKDYGSILVGGTGNRIPQVFDPTIMRSSEIAN